ncbi:MAG: hypothetical protein OXC98_00895 [bacterium]|nr:hypothetical protein [Acidimicrobiia bacterium]MCY4648915.1 hypothetical protein [bacterium]
MRTLVQLHTSLGWWVATATGLVGLWGVALAIMRRPPGRSFNRAVGAVIVSMTGQVLLGLVALNLAGTRLAGSQHVFYGVLVLFTFAFAYIYRETLRRRPALYVGLLLLFVMGLGIRGISTFGGSF